VRPDAPYALLVNMNVSDIESTVIEKLLSLEQAETIEAQDRISREIAMLGEKAIPHLVSFTRRLPMKFSRLETVTHIIDLMDYPKNRDGIPFLIDVIANINHPGWETAVSTLKKIGDPIIPGIKKTINYCLKDPDEYSPQIQGLCDFIELLEPDMIRQLIHDLLLLLEVGTDSNFVDYYALHPLIKIGSPDAELALPFIEMIIISERSEFLRAFSIRALRHFDPKIVSAYTQIVEECLKVESIRIHDEAVLTLEWLKQYMQ